MLEAIETVGRPKTFLKDTFFAGEKTFVTEEVLFDVKKGRRLMAPVVAPRVGGITVERDAFRTEKLLAPRVAPQRVMTLDDLMKRGFGEQVNSRKTPAQRQLELTAQDLTELNDSISRREEWMAAQALFEGQVTLRGRVSDTNDRYVEQQVDYGFTNKVVLSGTSMWAGADSDIVGNIRSWRQRVIKSSGVAPDTLILGEDAVTAFLNDKNLQSLLDKRRINMMEIEPRLVNDAITFLGRLPGLGVDVYAYDEWYLDDDGTEKPYVPANAAVLAKSGSGAFAYGAITQMDEDTKNFVTTEGRAVPKRWNDVDNDIKMLRLTSRPVPMPTDVDGWLVAQVVG
ncbi:phage capsid protein [Sporosarcina sp. P33]|nr:phage capsid protein [Sporosarcina sp. P33]